jgi:hypothetical protein
MCNPSIAQPIGGYGRRPATNRGRIEVNLSPEQQNRLEAQMANGNQTYEAIVIGAGFSGTRAGFPAFARARAKAVKTGGA